MLSFLLSISIFLSLSHVFEEDQIDLHAIYVSVLEIEESASKQGGDIRIKIFANDLEDAIFNQSQHRIDLINGKCDQHRALATEYFNQHLAISIDGNPIEFSFTSCEVNDISIWFYYSFSAPEKWENLEVKANYLMELFPAQTNVVSITYKGQKKMFRLLKGDEAEKVSF